MPADPSLDDIDRAGIYLHALVAMDPHRVIGYQGGLPWHLPDDLKLFKQRTLGHPILMGRATYESLPGGRPLPRRRNLVLSRTLKNRPGVEIIASPGDLIDLGIQGDAYLIGGAAIFQAYLHLCTTIILTLVKTSHSGDTFMPPFEDAFRFDETLHVFPDFEVQRHVRSVG